MRIYALFVCVLRIFFSPGKPELATQHTSPTKAQKNTLFFSTIHSKPVAVQPAFIRHVVHMHDYVFLQGHFGVCDHDL